MRKKRGQQLLKPPTPCAVFVRCRCQNWGQQSMLPTPVPSQCHVFTKTFGTGQKIQQWSEGCEPLSVFNLCDFCRNSKTYPKHQDRFRKPQVTSSTLVAGFIFCGFAGHSSFDPLSSALSVPRFYQTIRFRNRNCIVSVHCTPLLL